ncbi:MAG TPA: S8 family serine peptidase, partial [Chitinophagaceae bacterium]|nr:S8 family serine peptidase [Chitinophagaceae bacterium]
YTTFDIPGFDHPYSERDGNTAMISVGADLAAKKGILVFNSVGNFIDASTEFLSVPADGDSVVAVGSVNSSGMVVVNSSFGPSADGQVKPDVASVGGGAVVQAIDNSISTANGTSFACPNMAGLTACLWQGFPEFNNMKILDAIRRASNKFSNPDNRTGYGIPDMKAAFQTLLAEFASSSAILNGCTATISWTSKDVSSMKYEIERKLPGESAYSKVGEVNPLSGNILTINTYQFNNTIVSPTTGTIFYRIRQIIDTSATTLTSVNIDTTEISLAAGCYPTGTNNPDPGTETVAIRPNPAGTTTTMVIESPSAMPDINIFIYNGNGSMVRQLNRSKGPGKASIEIPVGSLAPGKYYITVFDKQRLVGKIEMIRL